MTIEEISKLRFGDIIRYADGAHGQMYEVGMCDSPGAVRGLHLSGTGAIDMATDIPRHELLDGRWQTTLAKNVRI